MKDYYIAALFAAAQVLLLIITVALLNRNKKIFALIVVAVKFTAYVRAAYLLFGRYEAHVLHCLLGFSFGLPVSAFVFFLAAAILKRYFPGLLRPLRLRFTRKN